MEVKQLCFGLLFLVVLLLAAARLTNCGRTSKMFRQENNRNKAKGKIQINAAEQLKSDKIELPRLRLSEVVSKRQNTATQKRKQARILQRSMIQNRIKVPKTKGKKQNISTVLLHKRKNNSLKSTDTQQSPKARVFKTPEKLRDVKQVDHPRRNIKLNKKTQKVSIRKPKNNDTVSTSVVLISRPSQSKNIENATLLMNESIPWRHITQPQHCGTCVWKECVELTAMKQICPAGVLRDSCGCCLECASGLRWPCDPSIEGHQRRMLPCGLDLECVPKVPTATDNTTSIQLLGQCECTMHTAVCASDNRTFENICEFREVAIRSPALRIKHEGPCRTAPSLRNVLQNTYNGEGEIASFKCEIIGFPLPHITWRRRKASSNQNNTNEEEDLPGYHNNVLTQTRGGPERYQLTSWLTVDGILLTDAGDYICRSSNDEGFVEATATLTVVELRK